MLDNNINFAILAIVETITENYELLKFAFKDAITKARLVENVINIYAKKGMKLSSKQIDDYREFAKVRQEANERFEKLIKNQNSYTMSYMLKDNSDLNILYEKVNKVKDNQDEMMSLCNELIQKSNVVLEAL